MWGLAKTLCIVTATLGAGLFIHSYAFDQDALQGRVSVIDGDTLALWHNNQHIRLAGIDAPEMRQTCTSGARRDCGLMAAVHLMQLIGTAKVHCQRQHTDPYARIVAECWTDDNTLSLSARMVRDGYAIDYTRYSHGFYLASQTEAERAQRGLWQYGFQEPWLWRKSHENANALKWKRVQR